MTLLEIVALVVPAFAVGMYFNDLLTNYYKHREPEINDIIWFSLNTTFVILNTLIILHD